MAHEHPKHLPSNRLCAPYVLTTFKHSCCIPPILSPHRSPYTCRLTRPATRRLITGASLSGAARGPPSRHRVESLRSCQRPADSPPPAGMGARRRLCCGLLLAALAGQLLLMARMRGHRVSVEHAAAGPGALRQIRTAA